VVRRKGIGAEVLGVQRDAVLGGRYPSLGLKLHRLHTLRMQIAQRPLAGPGFEGHDDHYRLLAEWNTLDPFDFRAVPARGEPQRCCR
jgi:hypothetical protein